MKSASLIRYDIGMLTKGLEFNTPLNRTKVEVIILKKQAELIVAHRREMKRLAWVLTYKSDIYGPTGRIWNHVAKFHVTSDGKLYHGTTELDPAKLTDGHGRLITTDSNC